MFEIGLQQKEVKLNGKFYQSIISTIAFTVSSIVSGGSTVQKRFPKHHSWIDGIALFLSYANEDLPALEDRCRKLGSVSVELQIRMKQLGGRSALSCQITTKEAIKLVRIAD